MIRRAHRLSRNCKSAGHPEHLIVYDTETRGVPTVENPQCTVELKYGFAIWKRLSRGTREEIEFDSGETFWDFVERRAKSREVLWIVAHNAKGFDLAVLEYERQLRERGWSVGKNPIIPTDGPGPLKLEAKKGEAKIVLADLANWYGPTSLDNIGKAVGCEKMQFSSTEEQQELLQAERGDSLWESLKLYCRQDVEVVLRAMEVWIQFLKEHDLGNFAISLAGQAMQAFRHRFMKHEIMVHTNERALELEREAYNGATVDCFRVGHYEGEFHVVDVNSEYPYVMKTREYPTRLVDYERRPSLDKVRRLLGEGFAVIGRVRIDTEKTELPLREQAIVPTVHDGRLIYPAGQFTTTLCTGELLMALNAGIVDSVEAISVYRQEPIFVEYVEFFYQLRIQCQDRGDTVYDSLSKLFMNSLYGKWGQRNYQWEDLPGESLDEPGIEYVVNSSTGEVELWRQVGDLCQRRSVSKEEGYNSFCAIAAHATSYARMVIRQYRVTAGIDHALYTDTDSLIVDQVGLDCLQREGSIGRKLGQLKIEESATEVTIVSPKNYRCGGKIRHKGRRKDAEPIEGGKYRQIQFRGLAGAMRARDPNHAVISLVVKKGDVGYNKGVIGEDGWTYPFVLKEKWHDLVDV